MSLVILLHRNQKTINQLKIEIMENRMTVIRKAEKIKALLICGIVALVPVFNLGYKVGGAIGQFLFQ